MYALRGVMKSAVHKWRLLMLNTEKQTNKTSGINCSGK